MPRVETLEAAHVFSIQPVLGNGTFVIAGDGSPLAPPQPWPQVFSVLQRAVDDLIVAEIRDRAVIHAGVVEWGGQAVLLPGMSGAGKTSLVRELVRSGCGYISDEYALLDRCAAVHPYPRPLMVRDAAGVQVPQLAASLGARVCRAAVPVHLILFLEYDPASGWELEPLTGSDTVFGLLHHTPQIIEERPELFRYAHIAGAAAQGFRGRRGEVGAAAVRIREMMERLA